MNDYRYNAFDDVLEPVAITGETHIIPSNSPYTIRLCEVPQKTDPSSITLTIAGSAASEVAAEPAAGEFWPDYSTSADGDVNWNTGLIKFNSADAGKTAVVAYNGMGSLVSVDFHGSQLFTAKGTFTVPKGVDTVYITGCGGGGGGGGAHYSSDYPISSGGGGGGGACAYKTPLTVASGQSYTITIGAGGAKSANNTSNGSSGGVTSFGVLLSLSGGGGGAYNGRGGTAGNALASAGGDGGTGGSSGSGASFACGSVGGGSLFGAGGAMRGSKSGSGYGAGGSGGAETDNIGGGGGGIGGSGSQGFILVEW